MNTLIKLTVLIFTLLFILFTSISCNVDYINGIRGNNKVVSETRTISSDFEAIQVQQGITLHLTQGTSTNISVEADENIIDLLITEVKDNELKIYFEKNVYRTKARNVFLTTKTIETIKTSSGAEVISENTLQANNLNLDSSSGSSIKITVKANDIKAETSSGSEIKLKGKTTNFSASSSSGSSIDAEDLESVNAVAQASSGANINLNVSEKLTANASSGGDIDYKGNPTNVNNNASSGGSISKD